MPANKQNDPNFFSGAGINEVDYDINGNPTGTMPVRTTGETQATPAGGFFKSWLATPAGPAKNDVFSSQNVDALGNQTGGTATEDAPVKAPTKSGVGAGTTKNALTSVNSEDNPTPTKPTGPASAINTSAAALNQLITTQPNQLDQYASYTYSISWYLLSPTQYNAMGDAQKGNTAGWQLLMQSGGAPVKGRSPAFPVDYYMDDLEIESVIPFGGTNMANSATNIRFKVTEPNGITLLQSIFNAVVDVYKNDSQAQTNTSNNGAPAAKASTGTETPNYLAAQYCLVIQFYGYDSAGKLVAPAKGAFSTTGEYGQSAVIIKYYPFRIMDIKFQVANKIIEYSITGKSIPQSYNNTTDRGTIPFPFTMTGETVEQLLTGSPVASGQTSTGTGTADKGARKTTPEPVNKSTVSAQAIVAATGTDINAVNPEGMAFGGGGLSGA